MTIRDEPPNSSSTSRRQAPESEIAREEAGLRASKLSRLKRKLGSPGCTATSRRWIWRAQQGSFRSGAPHHDRALEILVELAVGPV